VAAIVGPFMSGKTSVLESLLFTSGAINRKGTVKEGNTVGDSSPEARDRQMGIEANVATTNLMGESWTFLDCPGSVEFQQESAGPLVVADAAVLVIEADPNRAMMAAPIMRALEAKKIPRVIFINKMDAPDASGNLAPTLDALAAWSGKPLVQRLFPLVEGDTLKGYVDLTLERAFHFNPSTHQDVLVEIPGAVKEDVIAKRQEMLEAVCGLDDSLMEKLLSDEVPSLEEIYSTLAKGFREGEIVPVLFGTAEKDGGMLRLLKLLRHEAPEYSETMERNSLQPAGEMLAQVWKTVHAQHIGKQNYVRIWKGELADSSNLAGTRVSGLNKIFGSKQEKISKGIAGEVIALGRMDPIKTGDGLSPASSVVAIPFPELPQPVMPFSLKAAKSGEEVKLSAALGKLLEEDLSYRLEQNLETQERVLWGMGEIHLKNAVNRLKSKYNVEVASEKPLVPYRETIKKNCEVQGKHKRQSGGHGQYGDVHFRIKPMPRATGIEFIDSIVGGVVPRNYIPAVEDGMRDYCRQGPMGFPVVDISVELFFGSYHDVDSSDMAFKTAARIGMQEGLAKCSPVLLEPILKVQISVPNEHTSKAQRLVTGHRAGQILGFDAKPDWPGWDVVDAYLPQSEMNDLIIEIRSQTMGVGFFTWVFDHLQELEGREADKVVEARKKALEG
jgi:elongation factor G